MATLNIESIAYLTDDTDWCRECSGTGVIREDTGRFYGEHTTCASKCWACNGTGKRSVQLKRTFAHYSKASE